MYIGFDYGTANCSVAVMEDSKPKLLPLENNNQYIPSTLCAPTRESVSEYLYRFMGISPSNATVSRFYVVLWHLIVKKT